MTNLPQPFKKSGQKIGPDGSNRVFFDAYTAEQMLKFRQDAIEALDKHLVENTKLCIKRIAEITEERDTLRQQLAEAQRDADRYRWLRKNQIELSLSHQATSMLMADQAELDAAMKGAA